MKGIKKTVITLIILVIMITLIFFFWAKQKNASQNEYTKITKHQNITCLKNDSLIKIVSFNIGYLSGMTNNLAVRPSENFYKQNMNQVLTKLKTTNADIIGFQEIDFNSKRSYHINQSKCIGDSLFPYTASAVNWDKRYVPFPYWPINTNFGQILSGQSIMSHYPLFDQLREVLPKVESNPFYYNAFYLDRLAQIVKVKHAVKNFTLINIHAEAFDKETRCKQLNRVLELFNELAKTGPVILLGDFNSDPEYKNAACNIFFNAPNIAYAGENTKMAKTFNSVNPTEKLDYIFYTKKDFKTIESRVLSEYGMISDHLPFYTMLKFK